MGKHYWLVAHNSSRSFLYVYGSGVSFFPFFQASVYRYELYWKKKIIKDTTDLQQSVSFFTWNKSRNRSNEFYFT